MSDYYNSITDNPVNHGRLVKKRFDFDNNDTEDNTYVKDSGTVDYRSTSTEIVLASSASSTDQAYNDFKLRLNSDDSEDRRIDNYSSSSTTNLSLRSEDIDHSLWQKRGTCSVTPDDAVAPDGTTTADLIEGVDTGSNGDMFKLASGFETDQRYEPSIYIKPVSTSGVLQLNHPSHTIAGLWEIDFALLDSDWNRITRNHSSVTITNEFIGRASTCGHHFSKKSGSNLSFHLWGVNLVLGAEPLIYVKTTSAAASETIKLATVIAPYPITPTTSDTYEVIR